MRHILAVIGSIIGAVGALGSGVKYFQAGDGIWTWVAFASAGILLLTGFYLSVEIFRSSTAQNRNQ
jgi:Ni,Fe-hydrogenase I cytochrome b subunit